MKYYNKTEFAKLAGVSRTTIYNDLKSKLKKYTKSVNNKELISEKALQLYVKKETKQEQAENTALSEYTKTLEEQLKFKDEQIKELQKQLNLAQQNLQREQELHHMALETQTQNLLEGSQNTDDPQQQPSKPSFKERFKKFFTGN